MLSLLNLGGTLLKRDLALLVKHANSDSTSTIDLAHDLLPSFLGVAC